MNTIRTVKDPPKYRRSTQHMSEHCARCPHKFTHVAFVAKTTDGTWEHLCEACFKTHGIGLGVGKGQRYQLLAADRKTWYVTDGA